MTEKITTTKELDALPVGSVVSDRHGDEWTRRHGGMWVTPETASFDSGRVAGKWGPLTLVSRPDVPTAVVVKRFGDYDLALNDDGSVTWRDPGRVPTLPAAPAAVERAARSFEHTPEAAAFGAAIEQAAHDSGVGWDEVHPIELACRLMASGYTLAARQPAPVVSAETTWSAAGTAAHDALMEHADECEAQGIPAARVSALRHAANVARMELTERGEVSRG